MWAMNPLPYSNAESPPEFAPPCNETVDRTKSDTGRCSGRDPFNTLIVDTLVVPKDIAPGAYVLGLRWFVAQPAAVAFTGICLCCINVHDYGTYNWPLAQLAHECGVSYLCTHYSGIVKRVRKSGQTARILKLCELECIKLLW